jgi:phosphoglycolate phosphatase
MKNYQDYFFDMDGTIVDSELGIKNAFKYTFGEMGLPTPSDMELTSFIGPPLEATFQKYADLVDPTEAIKTYRHYYADRGMTEAMVYPGVVDMLTSLHARGLKTHLATSKNHEVALKMLAAHGLDHLFDTIQGSTDQAHSKTLVLKAAIEDAQADLTQSVMIGDRDFDIIGGQNNNVDTIGVLWGFGDRPELETAGATFIIERPEELLLL